MSKVATYLNEHLAGEVVVDKIDLTAASTDGSVLLQKPEMVAYVASTSDIRKIARFCWQLAEKGHILPMTARGEGTDTTGGAIGEGIVISTRRYMNRVIGIDPKQRLVHIQAGAPIVGANMALSTHKGLTFPFSSFEWSDGSVAGAIASGAVGFMNSRYGTVGDAVEQVEVVLSNGDILQTGKLTRRELNAKKGLHTMEGEIYRKIDNLISDNQELIGSLSKEGVRDTSGFRAIAEVKKRDGSVDLTPLFVGSQGSLGIITEVIMKAQFLRQELSLVLASYGNMAGAQAAADVAIAAKAASVELIDGRILERAAASGKKRDFAPKKSFKGGLVIAIFDDFTERSRVRAAKKLEKQLEKDGGAVHLSIKSISAADISEIRSILTVAAGSHEGGKVVPGTMRGLWLPIVRLDSFLAQLKKLEAKYRQPMPLYVDAKTGYIDLFPLFDMKRITGRQALIKLVAELGKLMQDHGGSLSGYGGDGRLKAAAIQSLQSDDVAALYGQIKKIFDPHGILNPGVKQDVPTKTVVSQLNAWCRDLI